MIMKPDSDVSTSHVLDIHDLHVRFATTDGQVHAVKGVDATIYAGECLGIVGESGSGKSQTFLAAMGLLSHNGHASGSVIFQGRNLLELSSQLLNEVRGDSISMIFQDPLTSLTPHLRIGDQMREVLKVHKEMADAQANEQCLYWLDQVRISDARQRFKQYPHELSGGMRQRVMIAMSMLCNPKLLIADEPTTALDVTIQADILDLMNELRQTHGTAIALITHDMGVVARMCDRVHVMRSGEFVEEGTCEAVFYRPTHPYTKNLLRAVPRITPLANDAQGQTSPDAALRALHDERHQIPAEPQAAVLRVNDLRVNFSIPGGWLRGSKTLRAVDGISFELAAGETLGVVGESGSGKSTLARAVLQLIPPSAGSVQWMGTSLTTLSMTSLKAIRREIQIVFQDPLASLNPSLTIGESIGEPLRVFEPGLSREQRVQRVREMMERVELNPQLINRYPHELSGGQNQRVGIARAMIMRPRLLICDEAVSALDVSIQAQIIALLKNLQQEFELSLIFISHDLSVVWDISQRVLVMYSGAVVEMADRDQLFTNPQHPYTQQLLSAVPIPDPDIEKSRKRIKLKGELSSPIDPAARLRFLRSREQALSADYVPQISERFPGHFVAEHDALDLLLAE